MGYLIYSDSLGCMVLDSVTYKGHTYVWNDLDCLYYRDDTDEIYFDLETMADLVFDEMVVRQNGKAYS